MSYFDMYGSNRLIGCGKTDETSKKHEAITFMPPYMDVDSFIAEVHKTYPEIELEVVPYSGANTTVYLNTILEENDLPDICTLSLYDPELLDLSDRMLDLSGYAFTDNYVESRLKEVSDDGAIYMLPSAYATDLYRTTTIHRTLSRSCRKRLISLNQTVA